MERHPATAAVALVVVAVLAASVWAASPPTLVVKGDPRAWAEVEAALVKLNSLKSYRVKGKLPPQAILAIEVVNPDRYRMVTTMGGMTTETIVVAGQPRYRVGKGPWACNLAKAKLQDPVIRRDKMTGEVTAARGRAAVVEGVQTQSYTYTWKAPDMEEPAKFTLYVSVKDGLPRRWQMLDDEGAVMVEHFYYDHNAPITITLPACK